MVGPSLTDDERDSANRRLQLGFVLLVGVSGGMVAFEAGGTPVQLAVGVAGGLLIGAALLWFVLRTFDEVRTPRGPRR